LLLLSSHVTPMLKAAGKAYQSITLLANLSKRT